MSIGSFLKDVSAAASFCTFYDLCVKEINRVMGNFMCEFNGCFSVEIFDEWGNENQRVHHILNALINQLFVFRGDILFNFFFFL